MAKQIKYVVVPGRVISANDRDIHYIGAARLMVLYKVDPKECVVYYGDERDFGKNLEGLIRLYPRGDGNYELPK